ncbi:MAG: ABC transporter ATP-binding protein [Chloroflexi bacterium]|jgi:ABC-type multidrug transport system fused ATPase/permease subunit|nr:ABC transporter ATP-binding protein [Chloroflexota bacterium]
MAHAQGRIDLRPKSVANRLVQRWKLNPNYHFVRDVLGLIWGHKLFGVAIIIVTIFQEIAALWPVSLLGQFVDGLQSGDIGNVVWLFLGASALAPAISRANVILRHKMFYETDYTTRIDLTLRVAEHGDSASDAERAGAAHTRVVNAVSGITNATYHILGSFTPVIIKIFVVSGNLLTYNRLLGLAYLASLSVPILMTGVFNSKLRVLRDAQYEVMSEASGSGIRAISEKGCGTARERFVQVMRERTTILFNLLFKHQFFLHIREIALVGSQFLIIFMALGMREQLGLTPGDFTRIIGYTTQVAAAFITTASTLDAIVSYSRAYHIYAQAHEH